MDQYPEDDQCIWLDMESLAAPFLRCPDITASLLPNHRFTYHSFVNWRHGVL